MKVNGKDYTAPKMDFCALTKFENWGISIKEIENKPLNCIAGFVALAMKTDKLEEAVNEIQKHLDSGGTLNDIFNDVKNSFEETNFFNEKAESQTA